MASAHRRAGVLFVRIDGTQYDARGNWTYNLGAPKREAIVGADGVHGFKEMPQTPFIEGEVTDARSLDLEALVTASEVTATLELANGKTVLLRDGWYAADGTVGTEQGNVQVRIEGLSAEETSGG